MIRQAEAARQTHPIQGDSAAVLAWQSHSETHRQAEPTIADHIEGQRAGSAQREECGIESIRLLLCHLVREGRKNQ